MRLALLAAALCAGSAAMAQSSSAPERDARGIPVVSDTATPPPGANQPAPMGGGQVVPAANQQQVFARQPATKDYPPCTREMTDGCVQTYERGVRRPR